MKKILWLSDFDLRGSGYLYISVPLASGLSYLGYEIKAVGLGYKGEEHDYPFSIMMANNLSEAINIIRVVTSMWKPDVLIVALDIPLHEKLLQVLGNFIKYIGIMPVESDPLCLSWAASLMTMNKPFIISRFGTEEAHKVGVVQAEYLEVGIDSDFWSLPTEKEKEIARKNLGILEDTTKIVLTVADNQERKNLAGAMEIISKAINKGEDITWVLVTREFNPFGWKLREYAQRLGINSSVIIIERGIETEKLRFLYSAADAFLLISKAEGLGLPILEAMAMGVPCVLTNCTGMAELGSDGRAFLIDIDRVYVDCFGNGHRYWVSIEDGVEKLLMALNSDTDNMVKKAREFIENRNWETSVLQLDTALNNLLKENQNE